MLKDKNILKELRDVGKELAWAGLIIGEGGNISARSGDVIYIKRRAAFMGRAKAADYIPLNIKTEKPLKKKDKPSTEIYMHLACYRSRKDVGAVIHTHPVFATALGAAGVSIKPFTYEAEVNIQSPVARIGYARPGSPALGKAVGQAVRKHNAVLLKNHGLVTVGRNLEEAFLRTLAVERAALTQVSRKALSP